MASFFFGFTVCPDGFVYAGDDETRARDIVFEVLDETEPYSCYRVMDEPMNYMDARDACAELDIKAKLLTLDGLFEAERFAREFNGTSSSLTSGLFFEDEWHWMGASTVNYASEASHTGAKFLNLSKNSHFENLIFHKIHNFKVSFFTKFTI